MIEHTMHKTPINTQITAQSTYVFSFLGSLPSGIEESNVIPNGTPKYKDIDLI
jgi:hypothetical protein